MAKYRFKGALNAARWPLIAALQGRTVINPQYDVNVRTPKIFFGSDENLDLGIPQIVYCENVLPTVEGLTSVGYQQIIADAGGTTNFDQAIILRDADENNYIFCPGNGSNYILNPSTNTWASTDPVSLSPGTAVTYAYVNGRTFVCYANDDIYEYDVGAGTFLPVAITLPPGLTMADVTGIGSSSNYLILFTLITVYWSSLVNVTDFTPSSITGAGSATPQDVKGAIVAIRGTSGGFLIYTIKNAVSAQYTNNARAPFVFKELPNSGGIARPEHVTLDTTSGNQYAWTTSGLLKVNLQYAEPVSGEVNDFLAGRLYNYWDAGTKTLVQQLTTNGDFYIKLALIANRYLVISYTPTIISDIYVFTLALVYDTILKRWGQVNIPHTDVFDFQLSSGGGAAYTFNDLGTRTFNDLGTDTFNDLAPDDVSGIDAGSKRTMAFLQLGGAIQLALMDYNKNFNHNGVVVFGRFQLTRAAMMGHQLTTVEGGYGAAWTGADTFQSYLLNSLDGYNWANGVAMTVIKTQGKSTTYGMRVTGLNYMLACTGTFALSSYVMEVTNEGDS